MEASENMNMYFENLDYNIRECLDIANRARSKGYDPDDKVSIPLAKNMAERVVGLISVAAPQIKDSGVVERIDELEKKYGMQDWRVAFVLAEEVAREKFCKFKDEREALEVGLRVGLAYITNGVVSSPLEGFIRLELKDRSDGKGKFFSLYFGGPIRSAGTTATCVFVACCDYVRMKMGYSEYDPTVEEIKRTFSELEFFHERVTNLQYFPSEKEVEFLTKYLPVQIDGDPSEKLEVPNYKDLPRVKSNRLRNGFCLVYGEGLAQKFAKFWGKFSKWYKDFGMDDWKFLDDFVNMQKEVKAKGQVKKDSGEKITPDFTFVKDLVAGRPVLGYPLRSGAFRLRYGRTRTSGFSVDAIHPATMVVLDGFIASATQLKPERPKKGDTISVCDSIEGPRVKLKNGSVLFLESEEDAKLVNDNVEEILYMGDMLVNYGDFLDRAHVLVPPGYCEEWWGKELAEGVKTGACEESGYCSLESVDKRFVRLIKNPIKEKIGCREAIEISKRFNIPLHPKYSFFWKEVKSEQIIGLLKWLDKASIKDDKIIFPVEYDISKDLSDADPKRTLELLGVPHRVVSNEYVVVEKDWADALRCSLGFYSREFSLDLLSSLDKNNNSLDLVNSISEVRIKDKSGLFIGARMGRPEKGKMRKLTGSPQVLFPIGEEGGRFRCFQAALDKGFVKAQFPLYYCNGCSKESIFPVCHVCDMKTEKRYYCKICGVIGTGECGHDTFSYKMMDLGIGEYFSSGLKMLGMKDYPDLIKGVRGTSNKEHIPEHLVKGILRAVHNIYVNKDGTTRFDMTEMCLTHFKPREIGTSVDKLKELGYLEDIHGNDLENDDQILELKCQDVVLPSCPDSLEEGADVVLFKVASFIDDLLEKFYGVKRFYNLKSSKDLVGHLVIGLSPHTAAGIAARIIGFSKTQGLLAHPYLHSFMRRDCLHPKTKFVYLSEGNICYNEIGSYVENLIDKNMETKVIDMVGTISVKLDKELYAFGKDPDTKRLVKRRIKYFIKGPIEKKWVNVVTYGGKEIVMTPTHDFMYLDNKNNFVFKKAINCKAGDRVLISNSFEYDKITSMKTDEEKLSDFEKHKGLLKDKKVVSFVDSFIDYVKDVEIVEEKCNSYCLEVEWEKKDERNVIFNEGIVNTRCDGDESCVMLMMDAFLNFSRKLLSNHRGATQDEPLVLTSNLIPAEVDDMVFNMDVVWDYPLEFYNACEEYKYPWDVKMDIVQNRLGKKEQFEGFGFTHDTSDINAGVVCSSYKTLPTMQDKVQKQMFLAEKLRSVDESDVARLVIERHFMRDIKGNLRKFSMQQFRCVNCNEKYRRPLLKGVCKSCGGKIIFTISEGSVIKYLEPSLQLAEKYELPTYLRQTLELTKQRIELMFGKENEKQEGLGKWF